MLWASKEPRKDSAPGSSSGQNRRNRKRAAAAQEQLLTSRTEAGGARVFFSIAAIGYGCTMRSTACRAPGPAARGKRSTSGAMQCDAAAIAGCGGSSKGRELERAEREPSLARAAPAAPGRNKLQSSRRIMCGRPERRKINPACRGGGGSVAAGEGHAPADLVLFSQHFCHPSNNMNLHMMAEHSIRWGPAHFISTNPGSCLHRRLLVAFLLPADYAAMHGCRSYAWPL